MNVTVVVPWRAGCPDRARAWEWVQARYALEHAGWHVVEAPAGDGDWCKASAVNPAVAAAPDGIVVVADADVWCDGLPRAVEAVGGGAPWAMPHRLVHRLTPDATSLLVAGTGQAQRLETTERPYRGVLGGGIVVAHRDALRAAPLDPRFVGWGQEDISWAIALHTLAGRCWRGSADLLHLWHPPQSRMSRRVGSHDGHHLHRRYLAARRDPALMRALIREATA